MTFHRNLGARRVAMGLVAMLVVGCTAGADPADEMDLETVSGDGFTIDVPQDWEASDPDEQLVPGRDLEYLPAGPRESGDVPPQIGVGLDRGGEHGPVGDLEGYVTLLFGVGPTLAERSLEIVERREIDVDVDGVEQAMRVEVTHPAGEDTVRMKILLLRTTEGPIWDARYAATEADFDDALAEAVLDSFALEGA